MTSLRERISRLMADKVRRRRGALVFLCLALAVGLLVERGLRQQGITLTAGSGIEVIGPVEGLELVQESYTDDALATPDVSVATQTLRTSDGETMAATVDAPADARIPEDAALSVVEIAPKSREWKSYKKKALKALGSSDDEAVLVRFFNISILTPQGEVQPSEDVRVSLELFDAPAEVLGAEASVIHFGDKPELIESSEVAGTTVFAADSFSVYGVVYTVDFAYEGFAYALPGNGQVLLSELFESLRLPDDVADVELVEFSNPDVMMVQKAGEGATIRRVVPDTSGDAEAELRADEVVDGAVWDDEAPDPWTTIDVRPEDYVLTSLKSFDTHEVLTVRTAHAAYVIDVTDPVQPSELDSKRNADGSWNLQDVASINVSYDSSYTSNEQERDAELFFSFTYNIDRDMMSSLRAKYTFWDTSHDALPTFVYDIGPALADSDLANVITTKTLYLTANRKRVAKLVSESSGKVTLQITDLNWFLGRISIDGCFDLDARLDKDEARGHMGTEVAFPGVASIIPITYKANVGPANKTVEVTEPASDDDPYVLTYTLTLNAEDALTSLLLTDTIGGKQRLDASSVRVNGSVATVVPTSTGFTYDCGPVAAGTKLTVTYQTTVPAKEFKAMPAGSSSWETNQASWTYNGDKPLDGGSTSYEVKKPALDPPTLTKTSSADGKEVQPGDVIDYLLTIEGDALAGLTVTDNMTDLQYVLGSPAATVTVDGVSRPDLAANMFAAYNKDSWYGPGATTVFNYAFPEDFAGKSVVITYSTKVIDQDAASGASVYGQQSITNTLSENQSWQHKSTTSTVQYEKEVETAVTKSASQAADGTITYTVVIGDGTTTLDGVMVKDVMSGNHVWDAGSFAMSGNNVDVVGWHATQDNDPTAWSQTAFEFAFPAGTGKGPVTITYRARPLSGEEAKGAGVFGTQDLVNTVDAGTGHDSVSTSYEYPEEPKFPVAKQASPNKGPDDAFGPDDTIAYSLTFGDATTTVDGTLHITDEMTDLQKLVGDVVVSVPSAADGTYELWNGTKVTVVDGAFVMPTASHGWDNTGVAWHFFDDGDYGDSMVRVFNFQFPDLKDARGNAVKGPVTVTYSTTVVSVDEAANANVSGVRTVRNTALSGNGSATTEVEVTFPGNLSHTPALSKRFLEWDDDGYTTWWGIRIEADASDKDNPSSYPLSDLTVTEDWAGGGVYYSTEYPVQNYVRNVLGDLDLLGASVTTDSGTVLQAGRDYTIDKEAGSFHFAELDEPVTIRIAIHNPDATINTFYQRNRVYLTYKKDAYNTGTLVAEAEHKRVKQEVDLTKRGVYDESKRIITWTVIFNPYLKEDNDPDWSKVRFEDTLPAGLEYVEGSFGVAISGKYWASSTPTPVVREGNVLTVDDMSLHTMYGSSIDDANGVGTGLNGTCYTVSYQTKVTDAAWNKITSSLTGTQTFRNTVKLSGQDNTSFTAQSHVAVGSKNYLKKVDETPQTGGFIAAVEDDDTLLYAEGDDEGSISLDDYLGLSPEQQNALGVGYGDQILYRIDVNPDQNTVNGGKKLTLMDRIDTNMELDTETVRLYVCEDGARRLLTPAEVSAHGITISYNDDVRYLTIFGLNDKTHYAVRYRATVRAVGRDTFSNTATLIGGGSHSTSVAQEHSVFKESAGISGTTDVYVTVKKIDENNITLTLPGAKFDLYKCVLNTDTSAFTNEDWSNLYADVYSGDPAIIASLRQRFKIVDRVRIEPAGLGEAQEGAANQGDINGAATGANNVSGDASHGNGRVTFQHLAEGTLYYWVESEVPEGYRSDQTPHYFVMYVNEDLDKVGHGDEVVRTAEERKNAAKALDRATQYANDITVAAMSKGVLWNVTNVDKSLTSITVTKAWEGDYGNAYETRPVGGIQYDLYQIDANGNESLVEDQSPVPVNVDSKGEWPSYTWYHLDSAYTYTVRERPIKGYLTTYSDNGKGIERGTITVTNTYVPKNTEVHVQKKWDPDEGPKPDQVMVKLYQVSHVERNDGTMELGEPTYTGMQLALTASNGWKDGWTGLPTTDDDGNVLTYTVREDVDAVNKATGAQYGAVYSDNGEGVVGASAEDPLVITNVKDAPGSLRITKMVTVNGTNVTDAAADGTYRFRITDAKGDEARHPDGTAVGDVQVQVNNGKASSVMVDDLAAGTYRVYEYAPTNGTSLVGKNGIKLEVKAGVTSGATVPEATFVNNVDKCRVRVEKRWANSNGANVWPTGVTIQVQLVADGEAVGEPVTLSSTHKGHVWDNLREGVEYTVEEVGVDQGVVVLGGTSYKVSSATEKTANGLGTTVTLTNTELANVTFTKEWGPDGTGAWPADAAITVQLYKDGKPEGDAVELFATTKGVVRLLTRGYAYTWEGLEANHDYTVRELGSNDYVQVRLGDTVVRNIRRTTNVTVTKAWVDSEGNATWPDDVESITATLTRRLARKYEDGAWVALNDVTGRLPDLKAYPYEPTDVTVTIPRPSEGDVGRAVVYGLDKYVLIDDVPYEYAYSVQEQSLREGYVATVDNSTAPDVVAITNTQSGDRTYMNLTLNKLWQDADGSEIDPPEGASATFELHEVKTETTFGEEGAGGSSDEDKPITVELLTNDEQEVLSSIKCAYGDTIELDYELNWALYQGKDIGLLRYGADQNNAFYYAYQTNLTNDWQGNRKDFSFTVTEDVRLKPNDAGASLVSFKLGNALTDDLYFRHGPTWVNANSPSGPAPSTTTTTRTVATVTLPTSAGANGWSHTWRGLPKTTTDEVTGTSATYAYYVTETSMTPSAGYTTTYGTEGHDESTALAQTGEVTITNKADESVPKATSVMVHKVWTDGNVNHGEDSVTLDLYRKTSAAGALVVRAPDVQASSGSITVTVNDGAKDTAYTLDATNNWTVSNAKLDDDKTYVVSVSTFDEDAFEDVVITGADSVRGSEGGVVTIAATAKSGGSGSIAAPGANVFQFSLVDAPYYQSNNSYISLWNVGTASLRGDDWDNDWSIHQGFDNLAYNNLQCQKSFDTSRDYYIVHCRAERFDHLYFRSSSEVVATSFAGDDLAGQEQWFVVRGDPNGIAIQFSPEPFVGLAAQNMRRAATKRSAALGSHVAPRRIDLSDDAQHNLKLPTGAVLLDDKSVTLNADDLSGAWSYTWNNLPSSEVVGGITYTYTYFVKETVASTSADSVEATYAYVYNTAGKASSGVHEVTITNKPTYSGGLKIKKTFSGLAEGTDTTGLRFRITAPDGTTQDVTYGQFTDGEYTLAETGLPVDDVYTVTELNAAGLVDGYTLVTSKSTTSASGPVPSQGVGVIELKNTYEPIKGAITVIKNVTLNGGQEYDDVAAGQRFKVGLEKWNGSTWDVVATREDVATPLTKTIVIGAGSTGSATFDDLDLGTYRAYELADDGTRITSQSEGAGSEIGRYAWQVTENGTYYTLRGTELTEHTGNSEGGVTLSPGTEDEKAPRNAQIVITNNKTERGSIKVSKALLYNGLADTTKAGKQVRFGLYTAATPTADVKVGEASVTIGNNGKGTATFDDLPFGTYYVFELDVDGAPVMGSSARFFVDAGTYTVSSNSKAQVLSHANKDVVLSFTNSLLEKGSIKVTKRVHTAANVLDYSASGASFTIGLFTKSDDAYKRVAGRTQTVVVGADGMGDVTFENLDFAAGEEGTTYYVFELDTDGNRLGEDATSNGYKVSYNNAGEAGFTLTQRRHVYDGEDGHPKGATVINIAVPVDLRIVKVDKMDTSTKLSGAVFALRQIDEADAGKIAYKQAGIQRESAATDASGQTTIFGITNGYYEVTETTAPAGYVLVGGRTFYCKVANGRIVFLKAEDGKAPSAWAETLLAPSDGNVLGYALATTSGNATTPATVIVGNNKGHLLPSSGGLGTYVLYACGTALILVATALALRQRRA